MNPSTTVRLVLRRDRPLKVSKAGKVDPGKSPLSFGFGYLRRRKEPPESPSFGGSSGPCLLALDQAV